MRVRIGIDVGGTFTDAVAIDAATLDVIGKVKVPTTHRASEGVARGIIDALHQLLAELKLEPDSVHFIAHGTTQATNALLEGDVALVGVVGIGGGVEGLRARSQTTVEPIELAPQKYLRSLHTFMSNDKPSGAEADAAIAALRGQDTTIAVIVASGLYSV